MKAVAVDVGGSGDFDGHCAIKYATMNDGASKIALQQETNNVNVVSGYCCCWQREANTDMTQRRLFRIARRKVCGL